MTRAAAAAVCAVLAVGTAGLVFLASPKCETAMTVGSTADITGEPLPGTKTGSAELLPTVCTGSSALATGAALVGSLLTGTVGLLAQRPAGSPASQRAPSPAPSGPPTPPVTTGSRHGQPTMPALPPVSPAEGHERAVLVQALAVLAPQLPPALTADADRALAQVGVVPFSPDGQAFDAGRFTAVGSVPAPSPDLVRMVARTERPGYADRGRLVTNPMVVVYSDPQAGP